ncbi:MAG: hypothetical protein OXC37_06160 [Bdellovibrionaceae bacterium]|nr:hypothetical protein [Pseudobdellovibrionaceae bacterium]
MLVVSFFKIKQLILFFSIFNILSSYALPVIPDEIEIPSGIKSKSADQIKAVFFSLKKQNENKTANLWKLNYKQALILKQKDPIFFCEQMKELSSVSVFPLHSLALIKTYEFCPFEDSPPLFDPESVPNWLKMRLAEAFYKRRKNFEQTPEQTLKVTIYLGENSPYKEQRILYLKHALALAKDQKNNKSIKNITQILYKESPSLKPNPKSKDYFKVAQDFRKRRKFKQAILFYIKVLNLPNSRFKERNLSFSGLERIYKIQRP